jgi:hypothetical protein
MPAIGLNPKIQNFGLEFFHSLGRILQVAVTRSKTASAVVSFDFSKTLSESAASFVMGCRVRGSPFLRNRVKPFRHETPD